MLLGWWKPGQEEQKAPERILRALLEARPTVFEDLALYRGPKRSYFRLVCYVRDTRQHNTKQTTNTASATPSPGSWWKRVLDLRTRQKPAELEFDEPVWRQDHGPLERLNAHDAWLKPRVLPNGHLELLSVPLIVAGKVEGLLLARVHANANTISSCLMEIGALLATVLVVGERLKNQEDKLSSGQRQQEALRLALGSTLSPRTLLSAMLAQSARAVGCDAAFLAQASDDGSGVDKLALSWNLPASMQDVTEDAIVELVEFNMFGHQILVTAREEIARERFALRSILILPITFEGAWLGAMALIASESSTHLRFNEMHLRTLERFATLVGMAWERQKEADRFSSIFFKTLTMTIEALELSQPSKRGHHARVSALAGDVGQEMGLSEEQLKTLKQAALLHDVGLQGGQDAAISVALEFQHPLIGAEMVGALPNGEKLGIIIAQHHETYDGFGFPLALSGDELDLSGQVLALSEWVTERTTASPVAQAESLDACAKRLSHEANRRFEATLTEAGESVLKRWIAAPFSGGHCVVRKGCPEDICHKCSASTAEVPCWEVPAEKRQCELHGDTNCQGCFVWRTWGPRQYEENS